jgi:transcriptional regulator with XRE-family HTH domain
MPASPASRALAERPPAELDRAEEHGQPPDAAPRAKPVVRDPDDISQHLCDRVRELRRQKGWTLEQLSTACGVSRSMLSQIEREKANPTLAVTLRIAHAFDMTLSELVESTEPPPSIEVIRADDERHIYRSDAACRIRTLSPLNLEKDVEFYAVRLAPGGTLRSAPHFEGTREFLTVESGTIRVESEAAASELTRGDSASYRADVPHALVNLGQDEANVFLVVIYA